MGDDFFRAMRKGDDIVIKNNDRKSILVFLKAQAEAVTKAPKAGSLKATTMAPTGAVA